MKSSCLYNILINIICGDASHDNKRIFRDVSRNILILNKKQSDVRAMDIVRFTGYSKPSISRGVSLLKKNHHIEVDTKIAADDACKIEHVISNVSFAKIKEHAGMEQHDK